MEMFNTENGHFKKIAYDFSHRSFAFNFNKSHGSPCDWARKRPGITCWTIPLFSRSRNTIILPKNVR